MRIFEDNTPEENYEGLLNQIFTACVCNAPTKNKKSQISVPRNRRILMRNQNNLQKKFEKSSSVTEIGKLEPKKNQIEKKLMDSSIARRGRKR